MKKFITGATVAAVAGYAYSCYMAWVAWDNERYLIEVGRMAERRTKARRLLGLE